MDDETPHIRRGRLIGCRRPIQLAPGCPPPGTCSSRPACAVMATWARINRTARVRQTRPVTRRMLAVRARSAAASDGCCPASSPALLGCDLLAPRAEMVGSVDRGPVARDQPCSRPASRSGYRSRSSPARHAGVVTRAGRGHPADGCAGGLAPLADGEATQNPTRQPPGAPAQRRAGGSRPGGTETRRARTSMTIHPPLQRRGGESRHSFSQRLNFSYTIRHVCPHDGMSSP